MATSGKEAIEYIDERQGEVQCILLDIMMPQENGVETLAKIRKHDKVRRDNLKPGYEEEEPIKVIAVTALKHEEVLSLCESSAEAGHSVMFDGYIEKPATLTKIRDAMETSAIMFASSLPSGLDLKAENNNNNNSTKILAAIAERGNSDGGSGGSDPTTDGGGSGGRGGSNEGTDTRNKGSNEIDNGTSSDEKGQTQSKGFGEKSAKAGKGKKQDQIDKLKEEENDDENNQHKRAASPGLRGNKAEAAHSGDNTSAPSENDLEKYGSNERNVGGGDKSKRPHFNDGDTAAAGNENTGGVSNEDATNRKDTTVLENPDDKNRSRRRSERSRRNQTETRYSPSRRGMGDVTNVDEDEDKDNDTCNEKDTDSEEHQGSAGGSGKNSEEPNQRETSPHVNSGGSREGSGGSGNAGSGGSGAETTLNIQMPKEGDASDEMDKDRGAQVKAEIATGKDVKDEEDPDSLDADGDVPMIPATDNTAQQNMLPQQPKPKQPQKTQKELEREQNIAGRADANNHRPCARCHSNETRFCYYNNGLLSQPRYYCRSCQRYWTEGGTQRNLPKGSGRRKDRGNPSAHHASGGGSGGAGGGNNTESPVMNAAASLAGLASAAGTTLESHGAASMQQPNFTAAAAVAGQQGLLPNQMVGNQLPFNFAGVQAAQIAAAARNGVGGGFSSIGSQSANADTAKLAGMHSAANADAHVAQLLSSVAGYDVNMAASLVGFAAARVGEEIARNAKMIHGDSPGADISERVVTLAKMTGWRIGTAISTIAMASVEHGMTQADVNSLVQEQLPIVTSQATMEANAILQTMSSSATIEKSPSETNNNNNGKKTTVSGTSGGSGGTGVDSMGNNINTQATSAPEASMLVMQQAQQAAVAQWMNDLGGAPMMQQQLQQLQLQQQLLLLQQQQQQQQQQQDGKSAQAAQYASLLMNLTGRGVVDARTKSDELKKSTDNN